MPNNTQLTGHHSLWGILPVMVWKAQQKKQLQATSVVRRRVILGSGQGYNPQSRFPVIHFFQLDPHLLSIHSLPEHHHQLEMEYSNT